MAEKQHRCKSKNNLPKHYSQLQLVTAIETYTVRKITSTLLKK